MTVRVIKKNVPIQTIPPIQTGALNQALINKVVIHITQEFIMNLEQAIHVITALFKMLDGKPAMPLPNSIKAKLAKAIEVLRTAGKYALESEGMYGTIVENRGLYTSKYLPIKDRAVDGSGTIEELFIAQMKALQAPATDAVKTDDLTLDTI